MSYEVSNYTVSDRAGTSIIVMAANPEEARYVAKVTGKLISSNELGADLVVEWSGR